MGDVPHEGSERQSELGMKARVELVIRDEEGNILGQLDSYSLELGAQSLYEIEGAVEDWRQKVLPDVTAELLHSAQTKFTQESKKQ